MYTKRLISVLILGFTAIALGYAVPAFAVNCVKNPTHPKCPGGGGGGGDGVATVAFRDDIGLPDRIRSDGGPYTDGEQKVQTHVGERTGTFSLRLSKGNQAAIRTLFLDFNDCVSPDPSDCTPPFLPTRDGFSVGPLNVVTWGIDLRAMEVNKDARVDLRLRIVINLGIIGGGGWRLNFDPLNSECTGDSTIGVTRTELDTWVIDAGQSDVACLTGNLGGGADYVFSGLYHMPFELTVTD